MDRVQHLYKEALFLKVRLNFIVLRIISYASPSCTVSSLLLSLSFPFWYAQKSSSLIFEIWLDYVFCSYVLVRSSRRSIVRFPSDLPRNAKCIDLRLAHRAPLLVCFCFSQSRSSENLILPNKTRKHFIQSKVSLENILSTSSVCNFIP